MAGTRDRRVAARAVQRGSSPIRTRPRRSCRAARKMSSPGAYSTSTRPSRCDSPAWSTRHDDPLHHHGSGARARRCAGMPPAVSMRFRLCSPLWPTETSSALTWFATGGSTAGPVPIGGLPLGRAVRRGRLVQPRQGAGGGARGRRAAAEFVEVSRSRPGGPSGRICRMGTRPAIPRCRTHGAAGRDPMPTSWDAKERLQPRRPANDSFPKEARVICSVIEEPTHAPA
jgi:hypothetical protein